MLAFRNDKIPVAFSEIDAAYLLIGDLFERIHDAAAQQTNLESVGTLVSDLIDLFIREVACEKTTMILHHYPNYREHHREHNGLLQCLDDIILDLEVNGTANIELKIRLIWYAKYVHILMHDQPLCDFLSAMT